MKYNTIAGLLAGLMAVTSCAREVERPIAPNTGNGVLSFSAFNADDMPTRTVRQSDGAVWWSPQESIQVFYGDLSSKFTSDNTSASATATFTGSLDGIEYDSQKQFWALYPYSQADSFDGEYLYFYVETSEDLTPRTDPQWMRLFIDTDRDKSTGWNGYDFVVNRISPKGSKALLEKSLQGKWIWEKAAEVDFYTKGNKLIIRIPRKDIGVPGKVDIEFKWNDNMQDEGNVMDFYVSGDTAPGGRFNYVYSE